MTRRTQLTLLAAGLGTGVCFGSLSCASHREMPRMPFLTQNLPMPLAAPLPGPPRLPETPAQAKIVAGARAQIGDLYDASYCTLSYPNGDPPQGRGACTDVVVRGLRAAGYDLQRLVHADMKQHWDCYPHSYHLARPDPNIDHRRVPNLTVFFRRRGQTLPNAVTPQTLRTWQPGDIVCWKLPGGVDHTGLVSDTLDIRGVPFVIHNLSRCAEQDVLTAWPIEGHYRYPK